MYIMCFKRFHAVFPTLVLLCAFSTVMYNITIEKPTYWLLQTELHGSLSSERLKRAVRQILWPVKDMGFETGLNVGVNLGGGIDYPEREITGTEEAGHR